MAERAYVDNAADPKQVQKAKKRERLDFQRDQADLEWVLGTVQGRRFVWGLLADAGVFQTSFASGDPYRTAFNEGQRQVGLRYLARIQSWNPTAYHLMAKEAHDLHEVVKPQPPTAPELSETEGDDGDGT